MKINITLDKELIEKIDAEASKKYVSRSAYIAFAVSQKIQSDNMLDNMPELMQTIRSAVELERANQDRQTKPLPITTDELSFIEGGD